MSSMATGWRAFALCGGLTELFYSYEHDDQARAVAICAECPVRAPCRAEGMSQSELEAHGIWGGEVMSTAAVRRERLELAKAERAASA